MTTARRMSARALLLAGLCYGAMMPVAQAYEPPAIGLDEAVEQRFVRVRAPDYDVHQLMSSRAGKVLKKLIAPMDVITLTSSYGWRGKSAKRKKFHFGADYRANFGTPIYATADGVITAQRKQKGFGQYIMIEHAHQVETLYGHLSVFEPGLSVGSEVKAGDVIGYSGSTGRSKGPHLHYEVLVDSVPIDPELVMPSAS